MKCQKKIFATINNQINRKLSDPSNTNEYYQSYLKRKPTKLVKHLKTIIQLPKNLENLNIVDIKSIFVEHPITSFKLSRTIK